LTLFLNIVVTSMSENTGDRPGLPGHHATRSP
jgi:hypothetical protein